MPLVPFLALSPLFPSPFTKCLSCLHAHSLSLLHAGQCWSEMDARTGRCNSLLSLDTTREECCRASGSGVGGGAFAAFSSRDLKPGELFFFRAFRGGVPCEPCQSEYGETIDRQRKAYREKRGTRSERRKKRKGSEEIKSDVTLHTHWTPARTVHSLSSLFFFSFPLLT